MSIPHRYHPSLFSFLFPAAFMSQMNFFPVRRCHAGRRYRQRDYDTETWYPFETSITLLVQQTWIKIICVRHRFFWNFINIKIKKGRSEFNLFIIFSLNLECVEIQSFERERQKICNFIVPTRLIPNFDDGNDTYYYVGNNNKHCNRWDPHPTRISKQSYQLLSGKIQLGWY